MLRIETELGQNDMACAFSGAVQNCGPQHPLKAPGGKSPGDISLCLRCGKPFTPEPTRLNTVPMTRHCPLCRKRNMLDGLGLITPPMLLDKFTVNPALTDEDWLKSLEQNLD